jgi:hypothetical protein
MIIPVIIGTTGIVAKGLKKNLEAIAGEHSIDLLQKTAVLRISHIVREEWLIKILCCRSFGFSSAHSRNQKFLYACANYSGFLIQNFFIINHSCYVSHC